MSKQHNPAPVPPANRPQSGPQSPEVTDPADQAAQTGGDQEHEPKRGIGGFEGKGEHSRQQPSPLNDGTTHSK